MVPSVEEALQFINDDSKGASAGATPVKKKKKKNKRKKTRTQVTGSAGKWLLRGVRLGASVHGVDVLLRLLQSQQWKLERAMWPLLMLLLKPALR